MSRFEDNFFSYFEKLYRYMKAQPLNLGGFAAYSGGYGGPPGGYIGWLPQTRVTYDYSEAAASGIPASGMSLLDNLNHIRYRIETLEDYVITPGITVQDNDVIIGSGITIVNFEGDSVVTNDGGNKVTVTVTATVDTGDTFIPSGIFNESLNSQIPGTHYTLSGVVHEDSLRVYYNGVRQAPTYYTVDPGDDGFTLTFTPLAGDNLFADYDTLVPLEVAVPSGITLAFLQANYYNKTEIDGMLATGFFNKTIYQQFIFTVEGGVAEAEMGIKPLRIYAHDIGGATATITEVLCSVDTPPTDAVHVDVYKNGVSIFNAPSYVIIPSGSNTGVRNSDFASSTFVKDDYFKIGIDQVDADASDLTVHIRFNWEA